MDEINVFKATNMANLVHEMNEENKIDVIIVIH